MMCYSKLQYDFWLLRWEIYRFTFFTIVVKMFQQIQVYEEDANLQRILWYEDFIDEI